MFKSSGIFLSKSLFIPSQKQQRNGNQGNPYNNTHYISTLTLRKATYSNRMLRLSIMENECLSKIYQTQAVIALFLNLLLMLFICKHKKLLKRNSIKFFMNVQVSHICMACVTIAAQHYLGNIVPLLNNGFLLCLFLGMLLTTVDRHLQIRFPMLYQRFQTRHVFMATSSTWLAVVIFDCCVLLLPKLQNEIFLILMSSILLMITYVVLISSNISVLMVARRHQKDIYRLYKGDLNTAKNLKNSLKATKTCVTIVASYVLLWLPFLTHNILSLGGIYRPDGEKMFTQSVEIFALSNAIVDPMLFVAFHKEMKGMAKKYLRRRANSEWQNGSNTKTIGTSN